jgi:hypothetical protein
MATAGPHARHAPCSVFVPCSWRLPDHLPDPVEAGGTGRDETAPPNAEKPANTWGNGTRRHRPTRGSSNSSPEVRSFKSCPRHHRHCAIGPAPGPFAVVGATLRRLAAGRFVAGGSLWSRSGMSDSAQERHDRAVARGEDFYFDPDTGLLVMTGPALLARGECCGSGCRHCPFPPEMH